MNAKVKICGLFRDEDIEYANRVHPDYIGFVFYTKSKRYVTYERAYDLKQKLNPFIKAVGVFVDTPADEIIKLLENGTIDVAQLHGNESEEEIVYIRAVTGKEVIKAVKVKAKEDVLAWLDSEADYLLFDSGMGSGATFGWELLSEISRPFFLAGGLHTENLREAFETVRPYGVDLSSGVETEGIKDFDKMKEVVEIVRNVRYYE